MKAGLITTFSRYSEPAFTAKALAIKTALLSEEGRALFPDPWGDPAQNPTRAQLAEAVDRHETLYAAATNGGKTEITARNDSRIRLTELFQNLAPILEAIANHDVATLSRCGYDLRKLQPAPRITGTLPPPQNLRLARGAASGILLVTTSKLPGAKSYDVWICTGDPNNEANWRHALTAGRCRTIEITGLPVGIKHHVRVRGIGSKGPGGWSNLESLIVI